jgi:hypothetical protein
VILRWLIQRDIVVIPKSVRAERMRENIDVFDFELTDEEMTRVAGLDSGGTLFFDHADPAMVSGLDSRPETIKAGVEDRWAACAQITSTCSTSTASIPPCRSRKLPAP